ncbi:MAG: hypothetical protein IH600_05865 [Bacteroidetes bacterium]|nr:hypothetical protein [Bacteroidota bacterium]
MDVILAGTGETVDLPIIIFGIALLFGLIFFALWFPSWRRQRLYEQREAEYMQAYLDSNGEMGKSSQESIAESGESHATSDSDITVEGSTDATHSDRIEGIPPFV